MTTEALPTLAAGDAAWLLVLVENAVPSDPSPESPMNWEGEGRQAAYRMLAGAAGAQLLLCGVNGCPLGDMHSGAHAPATSDRPVAAPDLRRDLAAVLNRHGMDSKTGTPDFILADHVINGLLSLAEMNSRNATWHGDSHVAASSSPETGQ